MRMRLWMATALALSLVSVGSTQQITADQMAAQSSIIFDKNLKLDLYNQILPILFTKEQLRAILPSIERARQTVRETEKLEFEELKKLEKELDAALKDAESNQKIPPPELMTKVSNTLKKLSTARMLIVQMNTQAVYDAFMKATNAGQQKAAANSLNMALIMPGTKPEDVKDEDKIRIYVREILLHPMGYDILRKLSL